MNLKGKTALVTGASRGIGRAIALRLAREGALVAVHYGSNQSAADEVRKSIEDAGGQAFVLQADMGVMSDVQRLADRLGAELKARTGSDRLDILVNNAAIAVVANPGQAEEAMFDRILSVNLKGPLFLTQALLERISDGGRIVNISSGTSRRAFPQYFLYTAAKAGLDNFTLNLAKHVGPRGITANVIAPGVTDTDMNVHWLTEGAREAMKAQTPLGRVGEPDDIAGAVATIVSKDSGWITGQYISADGGISL